MLKLILEDIMVWEFVAPTIRDLPTKRCVINLTHGLTWLYSFDCLWSKINIVLTIVGKTTI